MNDIPSVCPKCSGEMIQGYVPNFPFSAIWITEWYQGNPQKSKKGILGDGGYVQLSRKTPRISMAAFRCSQCGFVEFYARDEFEPVQK